jgi:fructose-bisphosphate aldolase class II
LIPTITAMKDIVTARLEAFGTAGQASKIGKIYNLEEMSARYSGGDYKAQVH